MRCPSNLDCHEHGRVRDRRLRDCEPALRQGRAVRDRRFEFVTIGGATIDYIVNFGRCGAGTLVLGYDATAPGVMATLA